MPEFCRKPSSVSDYFSKISRVTVTRLDWTRFVFMALIKLAAVMKLTVHTRNGPKKDVGALNC